jgi:formylglycine-generating enzyme required for sulfatase activity
MHEKGSAQRVADVLAVAGLGAVGFVPLFGGPGYEAAVAAGVVLPSLAAWATAVDVARSRIGPLDAWSRGAASGVWLAGLGLAVSFLHGLRVGLCDPVEGAELFLLGPGVGAVAGGVWGAAAGLLAGRLGVRRRTWATAAALAGPLGGILVSLWRFYTSPMVFAFDPFFGFFAGTLYDSVITGLGRLATYRLGTLATLVAAGAGAAVLERSDLGTLSYAGRTRPGATVLAIAAALASAVHAWRGPALGHHQTAASIRDALGRSIVSGRCELVYAAGTPDVEANALARECDGHLLQLGRFFGVESPRVVTFLFANADQKGYLMGAASTYIAKPWRREIYIQRAGYPHPVMRHELAHVVAGSFASGPFRVAGPFRGFVPDPGRIEGVAVAAAPSDEELTLDEWAKAMQDLGLLPPLARVFKLTFLGEPSSRAYVVAGAFIDWLRRDRGMDAVRRWYAGASIEAAAGGESLAELERRWTASLRGLHVGDDVLQVAKARFDQPAIFGRKCPHVVDRIAQDAGSALAQLDTARARRLYGELLRLDPHDLGSRLGLATCALREGDLGAARALYEGVATDASLGKTVRSRAIESLGDLGLTAGQGEEARRRFDEVASVVVDSDRLRTLDVKRYAVDASGRAAILEHLLGDPRVGRDAALAAATLGAWAEREPALGLADYLLARTYLGEGRWDLAAASLDRALGKTLPLARVLREASRLRVFAACALGDRDRARSAFAAWTQLDGPRAPERSAMAELLERCTGLPPVPVEAQTAPVVPSGGQPSPTGAGPSGPAAPAAAGSCAQGMVHIPAAETWIGSPRGQGAEDEWPRYRTRLAAFCLDKTEVTVGAYAACVAAGHCTPAETKVVICTASEGHGADHPINCVDGRQAMAFCGSRHARLPTEAEWEYAASGGDDRQYAWGDEPPDGRTCWKKSGACAAGAFPAGAFGLFDMTGNVWEWTSTGYGDYPWPPVEPSALVYRGGSWSRRFDKWMRVRLRNRGRSDFHGAHLGFRCAATLPDAPCPFERGGDGECLAGVLDADCKEGKAWNGVRCAPRGQTGCPEGQHFVPGHGCARDVAVDEPAAGPLDLSGVQRVRSPEFDPDCHEFQPNRPSAYRFESGSHAARNAVERAAGCKNRDVGVGWNSACCP